MDAPNASPSVEEKPAASTPPPADTGKPAAATPPPASPPQQQSSILDDGGDDDDASPPPAADGKPAPAAPEAKDGKDPLVVPWDTLKQQIAGGDAKRLAELSRYSSFDAWTKAQWALRQKLSSGEYKRAALPENATDEEKAQWREEMGIPKAAVGDDGYEVPQVEGYEWTPEDEPLLEAFLTDMHTANAPQEQVNAALGWYGKFIAQQRQQAFEADKIDRETRGDQLRADWKNEYRGNIKLIDRYLTDKDVFPDGFREMFGQARAPDGRLLINKPGVADWLVSLARDTYGAGSMMYGDARVGAENRLAEIEKVMNTDYNRYIAEKLDEEAIQIRRNMEGKKR